MRINFLKTKKLAAGLTISSMLLLAGCGNVMPYSVGGEDELKGSKPTTQTVQETETTADTTVEKVETLSTEEGWTSALGTYESTIADTTEASETGGIKVSREVTEFVNQMTLEEKIYQMFIITPEALTGYDLCTASGDATKAAYHEKPVGGLIYFGQNLENAPQTKDMLGKIQEYSKETTKLPLFLCVDEEGGEVTRVAGRGGFEAVDVGAMANITNASDAYAAGNTIGSYLSKLGFNVDFAPDADVLTNPANTAIGSRSFGSDADKVTELALRYADGLHANGVMSTFKHFPGHGGTEADTHDGYAYSNKSYRELAENELKPFAAAESGNVDFVMVAHISVPTILGDDTPCSMSKKMITDILKGDLKYSGIVVTDAMNMGAISNNYSSAEAAVAAINAGVDMILMPSDFNAAYAGVLEAVQTGKIPEERINDAVTRIIAVKLSMF